jgi:signal recognition particle subunit SRP54
MCDIYRPAAIQQLYVVGDSIVLSVYSEPENKIQLKLLKRNQTCKANGFNVVIVDTAGRLEMMMMNEIERS